MTGVLAQGTLLLRLETNLNLTIHSPHVRQLHPFESSNGGNLSVTLVGKWQRIPGVYLKAGGSKMLLECSRDREGAESNSNPIADHC